MKSFLSAGTVLTALLAASSVVQGAPSSTTTDETSFGGGLEARGSRPKPIGARCTSSASCGGALFCNMRRCDTKKADGKACYKDVGCTSGVCGAQGKCLGATNRALGAMCKQSAQCASALCEFSKCAAKKANGQSCYKDVACSSGYCKDKKTCAAAPSTTTPAPVGGFASGSLNGYTITGQGSFSVVSEAACGSSKCAQGVIGAGQSASIARPVSAAQAKRMLEAMKKRQSSGGRMTYVSQFYHFLPTLTAPANADITDYNSPYKCIIWATINGARWQAASYLSHSTAWASLSAPLYSPDTIKTIGADFECGPQTSMTVLMTDFEYLDLDAYSSSESAGLSPTGFASPPTYTTAGVATKTVDEGESSSTDSSQNVQA